jgi:hypothetical protein
MWSSDGVEVDWFDGLEEPLLVQDSGAGMSWETSDMYVETALPNAISRNQTSQTVARD